MQIPDVKPWDAPPSASAAELRQPFADDISNPLAVLANISLRDEESDAFESLPPEKMRPYDLFLKPHAFYAEGDGALTAKTCNRADLLNQASILPSQTLIRAPGIRSILVC
jgi:hypothetical protein